MTSVIRDEDNGYAELQQTVRKWRKKIIKVGVNENVHAGSRGLSNAELGAIHEFGLGVPERSFLRAWVDQQRSEWMSWLREGVLASLMKGRAWAEKFGEYSVGQVRARIREGIDPPISPATAKKRGDGPPLIDTEQLINAVEYEVES